MTAIDWLCDLWLPYQVTVALMALMLGLALRAYTVAREYKRWPLLRALGAIVVIGIIIALSSIYKQFPPLSPLFLAAGLSGCWLLFVLGIERVKLEDIPTPTKAELESMLSDWGNQVRSAPSPRVRLNDDEYELAVRFIRLEQSRTRAPLPPERIKLLAAIARRPNLR
ncbi:MAG: hypothetical protein KatS3mg051_1538 [Anaerolineae bacterium]|nr:MAG: hypothetical protein KatS3mg051_1538 [Anaerolineae bacterium]